MTQIKLPLADIMQTATLKAGANHAGVKLRASAPIKTDKDGARLFRDLLGAMSHGGKTPTKARAEAIGAAVGPQTAGPTLAVAAKAAKPVAIVEAEPDDGKDKNEEVSVDLPQSEIAADPTTWSPPPLVKLDAPASGGHAQRQDRTEPLAKIGAQPIKTDAVDVDDHSAPPAKTSSQVIADLHSVLSIPVSTADVKTSSDGADAPTFEQAEAVEFRASAPAKVTVVNQETHLAPMSSPVQQVANVVRVELPELVEQTAEVRAEPAHVDVSQSPVKILTVRLDPPALGEVTVTMRLQGDGLEVHLVAAQHDTTQMLQQQHELLKDLISDMGYVADIATVQQADPGAVQSGASSQQLSSGLGQHDTSASPQGGEAGQRTADERSGPRDNEQQRQQWSQRRDERAPAEDEHRSARGRTVYL